MLLPGDDVYWELQMAFDRDPHPPPTPPSFEHGSPRQVHVLVMRPIILLLVVEVGVSHRLFGHPFRLALCYALLDGATLIGIVRFQVGASRAFEKTRFEIKMQS